MYDIPSHFKRRLHTRYGILATDEVCSEIIQQIQSNEHDTFLKKQSNTRSLHRVVVDGMEVVVVYNRKRKTLLTALFQGEDIEKYGYDWRY